MENECKFCSIVAGKTDEKTVLSDDVSIAFLDKNPIFPGHCLLVPREHHVTTMDTPDDLLCKLSLNSKRLAIAVKKAMKSEGVLILTNNGVSQSVPHLHIHIIPRTTGDGLKGFLWPRHGYESDSHAEFVAESVREALKTA